ncbi:magnesium transporter [Candidatus Pacearchaeota archaeon]|nr:magnesium transporter [Candidatus Pacearchaeota archaeon]
MGFIDKNFKEIFSSQLISVIGGIIAGSLLALYTNKLELLPGMLIILPGLLDLRGDIGGSFVSRITSGLFLGVIKPGQLNTKIIRGNIAASIILTLFLSFFLGVLATLFTYILFHVWYVSLMMLALVAGLVANVLEIPITLFTTYFLFKRGNDPNNIMGPLVTAVGDIVSIIGLAIALTFI